MTTVDLSTVGRKPPTIPSKWDIIPIHTSDRETFLECRRRWSWSSPSKLNLVPKPSVYGIRMPLWFGTGIHFALESYYRPGYSQDPEITFESWFNFEWDGGVVHESELRQYADRGYKPHPSIENAYVVRGLNEILPDPDPEEFMAHKAMGIGMMKFYKEYAPKNDNFVVLMVEHDFSVPIIDPTTGQVLRKLDTRSCPEPYPELVEKEVHSRGRMDLVCQDLETGQFGLLDNKTAARIDEDYFRHLDLDDQVTTYTTCAEDEAAMYDLEYKQIDFFIYNALRKAYPVAPTMTTRGLPSIDRQKEATTAELFEKCIKDNNLELIFQKDDKLQAYYGYLVEMGDKLFIQRDTIRRNKHEKAACREKLYYMAMDMLNDPYIYHHPSKNYICLNCEFRTPCKAQEKGSDFVDMLEMGYVSNHDR